MLNFVKNFLQKTIGIVSPTYFVYDFSRNIFLALRSINLLNFIVFFPSNHEILSSTRMFYLTGLSISAFALIQTLFLMIILDFKPS